MCLFKYGEAVDATSLVDSSMMRLLAPEFFAARTLYFIMGKGWIWVISWRRKPFCGSRRRSKRSWQRGPRCEQCCPRSTSSCSRASYRNESR